MLVVEGGRPEHNPSADIPDYLIQLLDVKPVTPPVDSIHHFVNMQWVKWIEKNCDNKLIKWATIQPNSDVVKSFHHSEWDDLIFIFSPRTKIHIGIRNIRITDIYALSIELSEEELFWDVVNSLPGLSYIFFCNILLYTILVSPYWYTNLKETGLFSKGEYPIRNCMKYY